MYKLSSDCNLTDVIDWFKILIKYVIYKLMDDKLTLRTNIFDVYHSEYLYAIIILYNGKGELSYFV